MKLLQFSLGCILVFLIINCNNSSKGIQVAEEVKPSKMLENKNQYISAENPSAIKQLTSFPLPQFRKGHHMHYNINWMNPKYWGGGGDRTIPIANAVKNSVDIQLELAKNWNYAFCISNLRAAFDENQLDSPKAYTNQWIQLANKYPQYPLSIITFQGSAPAKLGGGEGNLSQTSLKKYPKSYFFQDKNGNPLNSGGVIKSNARKKLNYTIPNEIVIPDGKAQRVLFQRVLKRLTRPINFINENGEVPPHYIRDQGIWKDESMVRHKERLGISSWNVYKAKQKNRLRQAYSSQFLSLPELKNTEFSWYAIEGGFLDRYDYSISREIQTPIRGQYYSTPNFYVRWPKNWIKYMGAAHGWEWIALGRKEEIKVGDKLFSPFVGAGWSAKPEENVRPGQWLGLMKCLGGVGAEFYYSGFFSTGQAPFPSPVNYTWQGTSPVYAQAITSWYEEILKKGSLLKDEKNDPIITYPNSDSKNVLTVVRKHQSKEKYVIITTVQPYSNDSQVWEKNVELSIKGNRLKVKARRQGSVYIYEKTKAGNFAFYQIDTWHEAGHPWHWKNDIHINAILNRYPGRENVMTEGIKEENGYMDMTNTISYVSFSNQKRTYDFKLRNAKSKQNLILKLRSKNKNGKGSIKMNGGAQFDFQTQNENWSYLSIPVSNLKSDWNMLEVTGQGFDLSYMELK